MTLEEVAAALIALTDRVSAVELIDQLALANRVLVLEEGANLLTGRVTVVENSTPVLEELWFSVGLPSWNGSNTISGATRMTLMSAPLPCQVQAVNLSFEYTTLAPGQPVVPGSNTNYWRAVLERGKSDGSFPDMAAKTTQLTGAEANGSIHTRKTWSFDSTNWNADRDLAKGDLLCLNWQEVGTPTPIRLPMVATVRYAPR